VRGQFVLDVTIAVDGQGKAKTEVAQQP